MNMLSAKKVRVHGMKDSRWTTRDKLTQYKGLINLFLRDKKIVQIDTNVTRKKVFKELTQLRKEIKNNREELENANQGDKQQLRNTLAEHKDMQLAYRDLHPTLVVDYIYQQNFKKRKELDRINYKTKQKTEKLIALKLELAVLEDRIKYEGTGGMSFERDAQIITGKVQDAILKKRAALSVRETYKNIIDILKKDTLYLDAILDSLKLDGYHQTKCMVRTTELGQLATEYLDDRKQEFKTLEHAVKRDMKAREESLKLVQKELQEVNNNIVHLIRRDSDINLGKISLERTQSEMQLENDLPNIEKILKFLQDKTYVPNFDQIYPCLVQQQQQQERLQNLLQKSLGHRDELLKKVSHAEITLNQLRNTMNESTLEYQQEKEKLKAELNNLMKEKMEIEKVALHKNELYVQIRVALQQLDAMCSRIRNPTKDTKAKPVKKAAQTDPNQVEEDANKILQNLEPKLQLLMSKATTVRVKDPREEEEEYKIFTALAMKTAIYIEYDAKASDDSLLTDLTLEDPMVPTRNDIKVQSKQLVELCDINEDLIPVTTPKLFKAKLK